MLLALAFRGVAFEFRFRDAAHVTFWDHAFCFGSVIATFAQGIVWGHLFRVFKVDGRSFCRQFLGLLYACSPCLQVLL